MLSVVITRREFEKAMLPLIERMEQAIVGTLEEAVRQDAKRGTALEVGCGGERMGSRKSKKQTKDIRNASNSAIFPWISSRYLSFCTRTLDLWTSLTASGSTPSHSLPSPFHSESPYRPNG